MLRERLKSDRLLGAANPSLASFPEYGLTCVASANGRAAVDCWINRSGRGRCWARSPIPETCPGVWALDNIVAREEQACGIWQGPRAYALLNAADQGPSSANPDAAAALADFPGVELIDARIRHREALANPTDLGLSVEELALPGPPACSEIAMLVMFLMAVRGWRYPRQRRCCDDRTPSKPSRIGKRSHGNT
jgi:hypothetical protein